MLRAMGLFKALRGTDLTPEEEQAIQSLEASLPDGWTFEGLRNQLVGRRPVKHRTYGAVAKGPERHMVAIALDGVDALRALASAVPGPVATSPQWAPPPVAPTSRDVRQPWAPMTQAPEEDAARAAVLDLLPEGAVLSPADEERFGPLTIVGVTAHLPDQTGIAGFGLDPASAFSALAARVRGELEVTDVWFPGT